VKTLIGELVEFLDRFLRNELKDSLFKHISGTAGREVVELAKFAEVRTHDSAGQSYFQNKSDRARALCKVDPEWPTNWSVAPDLQKTMMRDRQILIVALSNPRAGHDPKTEAMAQVNFDCWVALSSVASLAPESERWRNAFQAALQQFQDTDAGARRRSWVASGQRTSFSDAIA
jgi:hypothetical protein